MAKKSKKIYKKRKIKCKKQLAKMTKQDHIKNRKVDIKQKLIKGIIIDIELYF